MKDVQSEKINNGRIINKVGVRNVPVLLNIDMDATDSDSMKVEGSASIYTDLNAFTKGTHMSRLVQVCLKAATRRDIVDTLVDAITALQVVLGANDAYIKFRFSFLYEREAPISRKKGYVRIECVAEGEYVHAQENYYLTFTLPYMSLCPCSKELSKAAAHNQRSSATIRVKLRNIAALSNPRTFHRLFVFLVDSVTAASSSDIYPVVKREDEKSIVDNAYEHPMFVEDVSRSLSDLLESARNGQHSVGALFHDFVVVVNHFESIHQHDAVAIVRGGLL